MPTVPMAPGNLPGPAQSPLTEQPNATNTLMAMAEMQRLGRFNPPVQPSKRPRPSRQGKPPQARPLRNVVE